MAEDFDPRVTPARPDLAALELKGSVEATTFASGQPMRAAIPAAPMTASPDGEAEMISQILFGEDFMAYERERGWAWGQCLRDGYVGYVPDHDLIEIPGDAPPPTHRVDALQAIIYQGPEVKSRPIGAIPFGSLVTVTAEEGAFAALDPGGFTPLSALKPRESYGALWVATAERFRGTPYLWGGRTTSGLDCSGLIQAALLSAGIECPRDSDQQLAALGRPVTGKTFKRGDIVFWKGHVGIMTAPDKLLHANAHHMAVVEEPFETARTRIAAGEYGDIVGVRRFTV